MGDKEQVPEEPQTEEEGQDQETPAPEEAPKQDDDDANKSKAKARGPQAKVFSQREFSAELQKQLKAQETHIRERVLADIDLENARASGELSKVVESQQKRIKDLEPLESEVTTFRDLAEKRFADAFDGLPESIKLFAPEDSASALEKERWLVEKALPAAARMGADDPVKGLSKKDDPSKNKPSQEDKLQAIANGLVVSGDYRPM